MIRAITLTLTEVCVQVYCAAVVEEFANHVDDRVSAEVLEETEPIQSGFNSNLGADSIPLQDFNPSVFTEMPDLDVFGMFDPNFDLNAIDACLQGNVDLSFPTNLM